MMVQVSLSLILHVLIMVLKADFLTLCSKRKKAVASGYFPIFRYDPRLAKEGKSPLIIDMSEPDYSKFREFVMTETRFSQLPHVNPEQAEELLNKAETYARQRLERIKKLGA